jgi:hypothetical protein
MFTDPQTLTINAVATDLPRTGSGQSAGTFTKPDGTVQLVISHLTGKRTRRAIRVNFNKIASNPFDTTRNERVSGSVYLVVDVPAGGQGYTLAETKYYVDALVAYLAASSGAKVTQFLGGEA